MRTFALIGYPLSHSFSQKYFTEKFKRENIPHCEFKNFPIENIALLPAMIQNNPSLCGLSITIPYKQSALKYLEEIDPAAKEIGAVNCIHIHRQSSGIHLKGYNTDVIGFEQSLIDLLKPHHNKALILGTGGAAKAVAYVLEKHTIQFRFVSRKQNDFLYSDLNQQVMEEHSLIINATPRGMFPNIAEYPLIPYEYISSMHLLYDLIYNPEESAFLKKGREKGAQIKNGLEMLHLQAEKAWEIWQMPL